VLGVQCVGLCSGDVVYLCSSGLGRGVMLECRKRGGDMRWMWCGDGVACLEVVNVEELWVVWWSCRTDGVGCLWKWDGVVVLAKIGTSMDLKW